jgi:hypothetical protein
MENKQTERKRPKSTILLLLFIFVLFNAGLIFRAGVNTLYFTEDTSSDYVPVQATVKKLQPETSVKEGEKPRITPIFSFEYKGKELTMEAPMLAFTQAQRGQIFKQGEEHTLWVHKNRGELILPPQAGQKEIGRSQLLISGVFLLLAIVIWVVRNRFGAKAKR